MKAGLSLRWYQDEAVQSVFDYFAKRGGKVNTDGSPVRANPVIALPTGTGKSIVIAALIERIIKIFPHQRFLMLVHVKELIEQNYDELRSIWPNAPVGIYSSGLRRKDTANQIVFGGIASVANNIEAFGWRDIVIVDEAHLISPNDGTLYQSVISRLTAINPWLRVIGLSATPFRMGMGHITDGGLFTDICYDMTNVAGFRRLLKDEHLAPLYPKRTRTELDVSDVSISNGDFVQSQLQDAVDKNEITYAALQEMCSYGEDRQSWLVFTTGIEHSEHCADMLNSFGVPALAIHSRLKGKQRDERFAAFKAGRVRAICGNGMFTTGFNHPPVDLIGVLRPTTSTGLHVQLLGRGTRPFAGSTVFHPKNDCVVLDFAGNTRRLGPIDDPVLPKKKGKGQGDPPCCICEACGTYNHARATICICCGAEIEHKPKIVPTAGTEALLTSDLPIYEWFPVLYMLAKRHDKIGSPPILQVTFITGLRRFIEWVSIERTGYAGVTAREWWRRFSADEPPVSVDAALAEFGKLRQPTEIKVWVNRKYPEIVDYSFKPKGTDNGWGRQPDSATAAE